MRQRLLHIDIETYSDVSLPERGVYAYVDSPEFEILLCGYAFDDEPVRCIDLACYETLPDDFVAALTDKKVIKVAHNYQFERTCLRRYLNIELPADQWEDTMIYAAYRGLPLSLAELGRTLSVIKEKLVIGDTLIRYFSLPCRATKANRGRTRNLPWHDPDKWELYKRYNIRDVDSEREIYEQLKDTPTPEWERRVRVQDAAVNDRGVAIDLQMVGKAIDMYESYTAELTKEATAISKMENPNSVAQLKKWIGVDTLTKTAIKDLLKDENVPDDKRRLLEIRQELGKAAVKKYYAMRDVATQDGRAHGCSMYYGARTGRFSGRLIQLQNMAQSHIVNLDLARDMVKAGDAEGLELCYGGLADTLGQLTRTAIVPKDGCLFYDADFSAIEARVSMWAAGEPLYEDIFGAKGDGKIYERTAAAMFRVPVEQVTKGSDFRAKGKIATLACGYSGGVAALKAFGAEKMGMSETDMRDTVDRWREANPGIVNIWKEIQNKAAVCVSRGFRQKLQTVDVTMERDRDYLIITLPSGRAMRYYKPTVGVSKFESSNILFYGVNQVTRKFEQIETRGGKLFENIVQGIARDCLVWSMLRLEAAGYKIVFTVHDEVVIEAPAEHPEATLQNITKIMGENLPWAKGLYLKADGWYGEYFKKD